MNWRNVWFEPSSGRWRSGWRAAIYLLVATALTALLTLLLAAPEMVRKTSMSDRLDVFATLFVMLALPVFYFTGQWALRLFEHLPGATLGFSARGPWFGLLLSGFSAGLLLTGIIAAALAAFGLVTVRVYDLTGGQWQGVAVFAVIMVFGAAAEELILRGYVFQTLLRGIGPLGALAVSVALTLAVVLLAQPHLPPIAVANSVVLSVLCAMLYLRFGMLWAPIGLSAGWSFGLLFFGLTAEQIPQVKAPLSLALHGPAWLTGSGFGIEAGVLASVFLLAVVAAVTYSRMGLPLASRWWEFQQLTALRPLPPAWDFTVGSRAYQWKLLAHEDAE